MVNGKLVLCQLRTCAPPIDQPATDDWSFRLLPAALIPWLDPENLINGFGAFALLGICFIVFAETGLLVGFLLPGDTLLIITGILWNLRAEAMRTAARAYADRGQPR